MESLSKSATLTSPCKTCFMEAKYFSLKSITRCKESVLKLKATAFFFNDVEE